MQEQTTFQLLESQICQRQIYFTYANFAITPNISRSEHLFEHETMATLTKPKETPIEMGTLKAR